MKKLNSKGFLWVETLVVAAFSLTVLVILYTQFKNLIVNYNNSYNYNTVEGIYNLNSVKKYVSQNESSSKPLSGQINSTTPFKIIIETENFKKEGERTFCTVDTNLANSNLCDTLANAGEFRSVLFTNSDVTNLKTYVNKNKNLNISEGMRNFINQIELESNKNRLIAEYKNGTFATITYGKIS